MKENTNHGYSFVKNFWEEGCILFSKKMDYNYSPVYLKWINSKLGWNHIFQPRHSIKKGLKGAQVPYGFVSFRCHVCNLLVLSGLQTFYPSMYIARCSRKINTRRIMKEYVMASLHLYIKYSLEKKHNVFLLKGRKFYRSMLIGTWIPMELILEWQDGPKLYIRYLILCQKNCFSRK